jgi:hypothetical protein
MENRGDFWKARRAKSRADYDALRRFRGFLPERCLVPESFRMYVFTHDYDALGAARRYGMGRL